MPVSAGCRAQRQFDARAGMQTDAGRLDRVLQRALLAAWWWTPGDARRRAAVAVRVASQHVSIARPPSSVAGRVTRSAEVQDDGARHRIIVNRPACAGTPEFPTHRTPAPRLHSPRRRRRTTAGCVELLVVDRLGHATRRRCRCRCARRPRFRQTSACFGGASLLRATAPPSPVAIIVTRSRSLHRVVDHRAHDHHRVLRGELLDRVHHLVVLLHLEARRCGDVDQHAARTGQVHVLEQRALHRLLRRAARAIARRSRSPSPSSPSRLRP